jgi:uncharacterized secreted protein with C-terminal beta-propeller domain
MRQHRFFTSLFLSLTLGVASIGCDTGSGGGLDPQLHVYTKPSPSLDLLLRGPTHATHSQARMALAASCTEAEDFLRETLEAQLTLQIEQERRRAHESRRYRYDYGGPGGAMDAGAMPAAADASSSAPTASEGAPSVGSFNDGAAKREHSETNTQVEGVDEADIVKTDGTYLHVVSNGELVVLRAWPPERSAELARIKVPGHASGMYLHGDKVTVLSHSNSYELMGDDEQAKRRVGMDMGMPEYGYYDHYQPLSVVTVVDLSDPYEPAQLSRFAVDGNTLSSRRIDGRLFLVQQTPLHSYQLRTWTEIDWDANDNQIDAAYDALVAENKQKLAQADLSELLPQRYTFNQDGELGEPEALTACDRLYKPEVYSGDGLLTVATLDLSDDGDATPRGTSVLGSWGTVYSSRQSLYVAATNWDYSWYWEGQEDAPEVTTRLHKFNLSTADGIAEYRASGEVEGTTLNQFSLDEHEGYLRVATTLNEWWWQGQDRTSESQVVILGEDEGSLTEVGKVSGLGKGERIYAVRFMGDKGYVVTFRQVDPLYVLDLRTPNAPSVTGELKIPGFSSYIHPLGDSHLLTIGRDADNDGRVKGLQLQIFDVSNPATPSQTHKTTIGSDWGTSSEASYDHHAFTFFASKGLLAIPVSGWSYEEGPYGYERYESKLHLFKIDVFEGVIPVGSVSHLDMVDINDENRCWAYDYGWRAQIRRGVFIDDFLYSISDVGVQVHEIADLNGGALASVPLLDLEDEREDYGYCYPEGPMPMP